jgi:hypothetical protein
MKNLRQLRGAVCKAFPQWENVTESERAKEVIEWCRAEGVVCVLSDVELIAAMRRMPAEAQSPDRYLDFLRASEAVFVVRAAPAFPLMILTLDGDLAAQQEASSEHIQDEPPSP